MGESVNWLPAVAMLAVGIIAASAVLWRVLKRPGIVPQNDARDLLARRDALVEELRAAPDAADRRALEIELARVLRELDATGPGSRVPRPESTAAPTPDQRPGTRDHMRGFLWGAGAVTVIALMVFFVSRQATERTEGAPVTGAAAQDAGRPDADLARLERAVQQNPNDMEARLDLARAYLMNQQLIQVFEHTQVVLDKDPDNPRALSYQALVRLAMGQADVALQMLERALARDPDSLDARVHLAIVHATTGNRTAATAALEEAMRRHPEERPQLAQLLDSINASAAETTTAAGPASLPDAAQAPAGGDSVELVVETARTGSGVLFVVARPEGVSEGAPIAVKRMNVSAFPVRVSIGPQDSMMGGQLTEKVRIDVRLDSDGNAATKSPNDPAGFVDGVQRGARNVRVTLR